MTMAPTLRKWLDAQNADYGVLTHEPTKSSIQSAEACGIPGDRVAKAVVLKDGGDYKLAVLPASRHIHFPDLADQLGHRPGLADEQEVEQLFSDCEPGAVPPVGACYGLEVIVDDSLEAQPEIYFEGGDHATLIQMSQPQFARLMQPAQHGAFSDRI